MITNSITAGGIRERLKNKARNGFITVPLLSILFEKDNQLLLTHIGGREQRLFSQAPKFFYPKLAVSQTIFTRNLLFISISPLLCSREQNLLRQNRIGSGFQ